MFHLYITIVTINVFFPFLPLRLTSLWLLPAHSPTHTVCNQGLGLECLFPIGVCGDKVNQ